MCFRARETGKEPVQVCRTVPATGGSDDILRRAIPPQLFSDKADPGPAGRAQTGRRYSEDAKLRQVGERVITWFEESISHWMDHSADFA